MPATLAPRLRAPMGGLSTPARDYPAGAILPESARPALEAHARKIARFAVAEPVPIRVKGRPYRVRSIWIHHLVGSVAFEVIPTTGPGESYHVHRDHHGEVHCTCGDFEFRQRGTGSPCKHGAALLAVGLIPAVAQA